MAETATDEAPEARIPLAEFGRTGHQSSRVIFGAAALSTLSDQEVAWVLPLLDRYGVNHLDTAASYGEAELRLAPWLRGRRHDFFVATKTGDRTGVEARASLERSLERLGVDHVDLVQLHNLVEEDEWETAFAPGGAVEALAEARDQGLTRYIGVTGHGLRIATMHLRSLERFDFDSVLLPYNYVLLADRSYRENVETLLALCAERHVAVQTIKSAARRRWDDPDAPHASWYQPLTDHEALARSVRWVLDRSQLFLNSSSDLTVLEPILRAAATPGAVPTDEQLAADVSAQEIAPIFDGYQLERI